jgi:hypothetical protein
MKFSDDMIKTIIELAVDVEDGETGTGRCIEQVCKELREAAQREAFKQSALDAGIPLSVIEGRTKLSDHFSEDYIDFKCDPKGNIERGLKAGRAVKAGHDPDGDL